MAFSNTYGIQNRAGFSFHRRVSTGLAIVSFAILAITQSSSAQTKQPDSFNWVTAPVKENISGNATINLVDDLIYLNEPETKKFLAANGNIPTGGQYTIASQKLQWFSIFQFSGDGYVKDDEKIDSSALLAALQKNNELGIEERRKQGLPLLYLDGWFIEPYYDGVTKRLEWATKLHDEQNNPIVNFSTRLLGRRGHMQVTLVSSPQTMTRDVASFKSALTHFDFNDGERYSEFTSGDKVAAYGLGALVLGGAAAAVASKGGFKAIGMLIFGAFAALVAFVKKLFGKK